MIWSPHTTVAAIIEQDHKFLMVEERVRSGAILFNQPAGHLDENESLIDAVIRETREETAWGFKPEGLVGVYRWQVPPAGKTYLRFCFFGSCHDHQPQQPLDAGIQRALWLSKAELQAAHDKLRGPMVMHCIEDYTEGQRYPLTLLNDVS
ncbi:MAG: NUDIX hydrolase [Gammaproteobacteria bacterium]|nr:NUDIX hydrolase [Gammaproteobacteria bacterium]